MSEEIDWTLELARAEREINRARSGDLTSRLVLVKDAMARLKAVEAALRRELAA